jgi:hypothetical protein
MTTSSTARWLNALGYTQEGGELFRSAADVGSGHPYSRELRALLAADGDVGASAVFAVDQMPTVCFVDAGGKISLAQQEIDAIRQRVWNQNLVSLLMIVDDGVLTPVPMAKAKVSNEVLELASASVQSEFSAWDVASGEVQRRHQDWFSLEHRVDQELLSNLKHAVGQLMARGTDRETAQYLLGQCLFVSYLEHRNIVGDVYRERRGVGELHTLIKARDQAGLGDLFRALKKDFNGDFLDPDNAPAANWSRQSTYVFELVDLFLSRVNMATGEQDFWNYDFRFIPVELLSGIYETFLGEDQDDLGAFYTPRHLAHFAVDQAFSESQDIASEVVYDGACGSGILLTTAFRRMVSAAESRDRRTLSFVERAGLLLQGVRGSDISTTACRVTAFSLYLSLLEDLLPADIAQLQDDENVKLPPLLGRILVGGEERGDFFASSRRPWGKEVCTVFLSNPPWYEPPGDVDDLPYEVWARNRFMLPHRQIAAAFAHKAVEDTALNGRVCLILPVKLFTSPTSQRFVRQWLSRFKLERLINFSDVRRLMFAGAIHPCVIAVGRKRPAESQGRIVYNEVIDYWVPKADVSLAFGRLTVHGTDRHRLLAQDVWTDNLILRMSGWGSRADINLLSRLTLMGTLGDLTHGKSSRWKIVKGFNQNRKGSEQLPAAVLKRKYGRFLNARRIPKDVPILPTDVLEPFPDAITTVVSYGSNEGLAFNGPRVLFPDGASGDFEVAATFTDETFCFKHSVGAICGPDKDADLLRFLTAYLRSDLARYFLLHTAYSLTAERPRISLREVESLPFLLPENHPDPKAARQIVAEVAKLLRQIGRADLFSQYVLADEAKPKIEALVRQYFEISSKGALLVEDACSVMIPSVQPNGYNNIRTPYQEPVTRAVFERYARTLKQELIRWKDELGGQGEFGVTAVGDFCSKGATPATVGIVQIRLMETAAGRKSASGLTLEGVLTSLREADLMPHAIGTHMLLTTDFLLEMDGMMYLVKPLVRRCWLASQAMLDARRIVESAGASHQQEA